jgi:predicted dehydrogenase
MLRFEDGAVGSVFLSEISPGRGNHLSLEITCENGNLWWNEEENNVLYTAQKGEGIRKEVFAFGNGFQDTFVSLIRSFYAGSGYPDFEDGALTAKVCEAVVRSAADDSAWTMVR